MGSLTLTVIVPLKRNSQRVKDKNFRELGGVPLYMRALANALALQESGDADKVAIFGADDVREFVPEGVPWYRESASQVRNDSNDLNAEIAAACDTDLVMVLNATSPFTKVSTLRRAIEAVRYGDYDSACSAEALRGRLWLHTGVVANHDPRTCPRTQTQDPIYMESDAFWLAHRELFLIDHRRVGYRCLFVEVAGIEALDVDTEDDWRICELAELEMRR